MAIRYINTPRQAMYSYNSYMRCVGGDEYHSILLQEWKILKTELHEMATSYSIAKTGNFDAVALE
jgi:hypothetical protein